MRSVEVGQVAVVQLSHLLLSLGIGIGNGHPTHCTVLNDIDNAQICKDWHRQTGDAFQSFFVVEGSRKPCTRLSQKSLRFFCPLALSNVANDTRYPKGLPLLIPPGFAASHAVAIFSRGMQQPKFYIQFNVILQVSRHSVTNSE